MAGYGLLQSSTLGMLSQSTAISNIGVNIANVTTGGYKATDINFQTLVGQTIDKQSDLGGVKPIETPRIDRQGIFRNTVRNLDLAISGKGFFLVSPTLAVSGEILYTRDGSFEINAPGGTTDGIINGATVSLSNGYLVDKNGYFLLGVPIQPDGTFPAQPGAALPMRVDQFAFAEEKRQTTTASLELNLPAGKEFAAANPEEFNMNVVDSNGAARVIRLDFHKNEINNTWTVIPNAEDVTALSLSGAGVGAFTFTSPAASRVNITKNASSNDVITIKNAGGGPDKGAFFGLNAGDQITIAGSETTTSGTPPVTVSNDGTFTIGAVSDDWSTITLSGSPLQFTSNASPAGTTLTSTRTVPNIVFNSSGKLVSPQSLTVTGTWSDAATSSFSLDISRFSQFAGEFTSFGFAQNGLGTAGLTRVEFDNTGQVIGNFTDGTNRLIYKIPLAVFSNPNGLEKRNGMTFAETEASGIPAAQFADITGVASFNPFAVELSNVDMTSEFTRLIMVQQAYNSSATVFRTVDEMTKVARDLKT